MRYIGIVSTPEGITQIVSALPKDASVKYLIHNAGLLGPIGPLLDIERSTWNNVIATNLDAPLFLTQALLPHLKRCSDEKEGGTKARVLHVSSGAAHSSHLVIGDGLFASARETFFGAERTEASGPRGEEGREGRGGTLPGCRKGGKA